MWGLPIQQKFRASEIPVKVIQIVVKRLREICTLARPVTGKMRVGGLILPNRS